MIEMLMTLAIISIVLTQAWPTWKHFIKGAENRTLIAQFRYILQLTREEAVLRQTGVAVCASENQETCSNRWQGGFIIFLDSEQDEQLKSKEQIIHVFQGSARSGRLHWRAFPHANAVCEFLPSGATKYENGTFWYCENEAATPDFALALSQAGRLRVILPDQDGKLKDEKGHLLSCEEKAA